MMKRTSPGVGRDCHQNSSHRHKKLCTLVGGFVRNDGGQLAMILGTHRPAKVVYRYWTPGHPVGDIDVIELPHNAPGQAHRESIPYIWIFEGASEEEVGF